MFIVLFASFEFFSLVVHFSIIISSYFTNNHFHFAYPFFIISLQDVTNTKNKITKKQVRNDVLVPITKNRRQVPSNVLAPIQKKSKKTSSSSTLNHPFASLLEPRPTSLTSKKPSLSRVVSDTVVVVDIDKNDHDDPLCATEYVEDLYQMFREKELATFVPPTYMNQLSFINTDMREVLIDWLVAILPFFGCNQETIYLTVHIMDRFLETITNEGIPVHRNRLQLIGITCFWIASKYEDIYCPMVQDLVHICDGGYTKNDILHAEEMILKTLDYKISVPTANAFLARYIKAGELDTKATNMAKYILETTLLSYNLMQFPPSQLAAAAVMIARDRSKPWTSTLAKYTQYNENEILFVARSILAEKSFLPNKLESIRKKYSKSESDGVARTYIAPL